MSRVNGSADLDRSTTFFINLDNSCLIIVLKNLSVHIRVFSIMKLAMTAGDTAVLEFQFDLTPLSESRFKNLHAFLLKHVKLVPATSSVHFS